MRQKLLHFSSRILYTLKHEREKYVSENENVKLPFVCEPRKQDHSFLVVLLEASWINIK
jgi:hypothetical protein